jgi:iron complex transport system ATP-binding protein
MNAATTHDSAGHATRGMRLDHVTVALGGREVIHDVSARFERGQVTALLGPNGSGKSTLLGCLAGLLRAESGRVLLDGVDVLTLDARTRAQRIGLLPQTAEVHWDVDVATLVSLGRFPHRGRGGESAADRAAVAHAMVAMDVDRFAARSVKHLSGGERGRALLARVLAAEPEWLLADEPLASLDPAHQIDVLDRLRDIASRGAGVIVVVHDLSHAARVADQALLLRDGRVVAHGTRDVVLGIDELRAAFEIDVQVGQAANGGRFVIPLRRSR